MAHHPTTLSPAQYVRLRTIEQVSRVVLATINAIVVLTQDEPISIVSGAVTLVGRLALWCWARRAARRAPGCTSASARDRG